METLTSTHRPGSPTGSKTSQGVSPEEQPAGRKEVPEPAQRLLSLKSILVPIDFSKVSQKALDYAVPLARQFGARITLLHAIEPLPYPMDLTYVPMGGGFPTKRVEKQLNELAQSAIDPQLLKDVQVHVGAAFEVITNAARDCEADLIVLTTHGHTGLKHVFMGSTAERVVRHAPCPVLVVRKCEHEFA